jgi:hypothetical protein
LTSISKCCCHNYTLINGRKHINFHGFFVVEQEGAHEQVVYEKEIGLDHKNATPFALTMGFPQ